MSFHVILFHVMSFHNMFHDHDHHLNPRSPSDQSLGLMMRDLGNLLMRLA